MENPVIIFGAKGLGKVALDIFTSNNVVVYCFLDDDASLHNKEIHNINVMGSTDDDGFLKLIGKKCEAFVAVDETSYRKNLVEMLNERRHVQPVNAFHQQAVISENAGVGHGNLVNSGARINAYAAIGSHCILHSNALVDYDTVVGDFVQIGAGSIINSGVKIGNGAFIGSGVTIVSGITIGKNARIGAGSVVVANVKDSTTVFGNPAAEVKR
jgi:sugar O-acyltransferase (sialic acid O-acetyltransferase NeuD family)